MTVTLTRQHVIHYFVSAGIFKMMYLLSYSFITIKTSLAILKLS